MTYPLMTKWVEMIQDGDWFEAMLGMWSEPVGRSGFALLVGGPLILALWTYTESVTPPATLFALFSGLILAQWPGPAARVGYALLASAFGLALFALARRQL